MFNSLLKGLAGAHGLNIESLAVAPQKSMPSEEDHWAEAMAQFAYITLWGPSFRGDPHGMCLCDASKHTF